MEIYKSKTGKREVLEEYSQILADWLGKNLQYKVQTSLGPTFIIESGSKDNPTLILLQAFVIRK